MNQQAVREEIHLTANHLAEDLQDRVEVLEGAAREAIEWLEGCKALTNHRTKLAAAALRRGLGQALLGETDG